MAIYGLISSSQTQPPCVAAVAAPPQVDGNIMEVDSRSLKKSAKKTWTGWLVVTGTMEFYDFPYVGNGIIIPTDFNSIIFQRGWLKPPTRTSRLKLTRGKVIISPKLCPTSQLGWSKNVAVLRSCVRSTKSPSAKGIGHVFPSGKRLRNYGKSPC